MQSNEHRMRDARIYSRRAEQLAIARRTRLAHIVFEAVGVGPERHVNLVAAPHTREADAVWINDGDGAVGEVERFAERRLREVVHQLLLELPLIVGVRADLQEHTRT